ncbi:hypothetical protein Tco_0566736 [Tanacetum coccineum]
MLPTSLKWMKRTFQLLKGSRNHTEGYIVELQECFNDIRGSLNAEAIACSNNSHMYIYGYLLQVDVLSNDVKMWKAIELNAEQADWKDDTDDESDDQELEAHYMYMTQIQEVTPDAANNSRPIFDAKACICTK